MSSVVTIGFLDRAHACVQVEFIPPIADDERRETLIHVAFLTARTFAALPPEHQLAFAGALREWIDKRFTSCPVQLVSGDPMGCLPRFASSFLAPAREYALATNGCGSGVDGIEYFLPMANALFLRHILSVYEDPVELLKPALALCAAVAIHPITVATHFQIAVASLPKSRQPPSPSPSTLVEEREHIRGERQGEGHAVARAAQRLRETRRSLIAAAFMALLLIVAGVQYLSTRVPEAGHMPPSVPLASVGTPPTSILPPRPPSSERAGQERVQAGGLDKQKESRKQTVPVPKPSSRKTQAYQQAVWDIADNSLAQVEVMLAAVQRQDLSTSDRIDALDYGMRQLQKRQRRFVALSPPARYEESHHEIGQILADLTSLARNLRAIDLPSQQAALMTRLASERLSEIQARLEEIMDVAMVF